MKRRKIFTAIILCMMMIFAISGSALAAKKCKNHKYRILSSRPATYKSAGYKTEQCTKCNAIKDTTYPQIPCDGHIWTYQKTGKTKYNIGGSYTEYKRECKKCGKTAKIWSHTPTKTKKTKKTTKTKKTKKTKKR